MNAAAENKGFCERVFRLTEKGTTVRTEMVAGLTTFISGVHLVCQS